MQEAFIIDGVRSPIGKFGGSLSSIRPDDLAAHIIQSLLARHPKIDSAKIDDVILGNANQAGEDNRNVARMALLLAGLPVTVPGETVNRLCASGMSAVVQAGRALRLGDADLMIAGGVENMTRAPYVFEKSQAAFSRTAKMYDTSIGWRFPNPKMKEMYGVDGMGNTAENVADQYKISRSRQDEFAFNSQRKATNARDKNRFLAEIAPVEIPQRKSDPLIFDQDEFIRPDTSLEKLAKLKPAFRFDGQGSVTAGNSSGINDGACALLLASSKGASSNGLTPQARIVGSAVVGLEPRIMGMGPLYATQKVLQKTGMSLDKIGVIEINEAFASQSLASMQKLALSDDDPRVNPNGGAIALGHPLGMSGARIILTAMHELHLRKEQFSLCTMCIGVGQGMATIIERV